MNPVILIVTVLAAGMVGALIRHAAAIIPTRTAFPIAVLAVNAIGSFIAGVMLALSPLLGPEITLIALTGFCGGLTTFSTFSVDTIRLAIEGRAWVAVGNMAANLLLGLGAAGLGAAVTLAFM